MTLPPEITAVISGFSAEKSYPVALRAMRCLCIAGRVNDPPLHFYQSSSSFRTAMKASLGTETVPKVRIRFLPSFCFSSSFFFRVMSPP